MQSAKDHKLDDRSKEKVKDKGKEKDKDKEKAKVKGKGSSLFPILGGSFMSSKNVLAESKSSTAENSLEADNQGKEKSNSHEGISRHVHRFAKAPSSSTAAAKETVWFFTPFDSPLPIPVSAASNATAPLSSSIASSTSSPQSIQSHRSVAMDIPSLCEGSQGNSYSANTISSAMHSDVMRVSTPSSSLVSQVSIHSAHSHASDFHTNGSINTSSIHSTPSRKHENSKSKKNYVGFRLGRSVSNADSITPHEPVVALYSTSQSATDHIIIPEKPHHMMLAEQIDMSYARQDNMMFQPSAFKDEYGFPIDEDCVDLQAKYYEQVQQRTQKRRMGWYTYLRGIGLNGKKLEKNSHLVSMVRGGIPPELRGQV
eukprot:TRINITY_DN7106_c0_g1_i2.p1 TRINITY_DN7106_c0_g1~~TRINITY_DN7106_c0_g1_i2.p1  ORF type:complete len:370 (+),score=71.23 TRINITY_DN7106_c0_g1_i2:155-1264(+)